MTGNIAVQADMKIDNLKISYFWLKLRLPPSSSDCQQLPSHLYVLCCTKNVVKGCVIEAVTHTTFDHVFWPAEYTYAAPPGPVIKSGPRDCTYAVM